MKTDDFWSRLSNLPTSIDNNSILIFRIQLEDHIDHLKENVEFHNLSSDEIRRMNSFKYDKDRIIFATARYSTRLICAELLQTKKQELEISLSQYGKPFLKNYTNLHFSISHSGTNILVGFGKDLPLGVDNEICNPNIDHINLSHSVFSQQEIKYLKDVGEDRLEEGFYNCWTQKEAYIKAKGLGLNLALDGFSVRIFNEGKYNLLKTNEGKDEAEKWQLFNFPISNNYKAACCCDASIHSFHFIDITENIIKQLTNKSII